MYIVLVSFLFSPSKQIGARRWSKFTKELVKLNHSVTVITTTKGAGFTDGLNERFHGLLEFCYLKNNYPKIMNGENLNILEKIFYHFFLFAFRTFSKNNPFDKGLFLGDKLVSYLEEVHKNKTIDLLIISGGPFSLLNYGVIFKKKYPDVKYVADFRDPWTWGVLYGIKDLTHKQKRYQLNQEHEVVKNSDLLCYPTDHMGKYLRKKYPQQTEKLFRLPHCYSPEKFKELVQSKNRSGFIYGGTLYRGIEDYFLAVDRVFRRFNFLYPKWKIYSGTAFPLLDEEIISNGIEKFDFIEEGELFKEISKSAAYLALYPPHAKDILSTKFYEIIKTKTPIIYIGEVGEISEFLKRNRLGVHIGPEEIEKKLPEYLGDDKIRFHGDSFDIARYSIDNVLNKFLIRVNEIQ